MSENVTHDEKVLQITVENLYKGVSFSNDKEKHYFDYFSDIDSLNNESTSFLKLMTVT